MKQNFKIVSVDLIPEGLEVPVDNLIDIFRVITGMERLCTDLNGIGLAATQIGIPWNLIIILRENKYEYYLNCDYFGLCGERSKSIEGCLSLRDDNGKLRRFELDRFDKILVKGKRLIVTEKPSLILEDVNQIETGLIACVFQHELDHRLGKIGLIDYLGKEVVCA